MDKEDKELAISKNEDIAIELGIKEIIKWHSPPASLVCHHATAEMTARRDETKKRNPNAPDELRCPIRAFLAEGKSYMQKKGMWFADFHLMPQTASSSHMPCEECPTHFMASKEIIDKRLRFRIEEVEFLKSLTPDRDTRVNDPALGREKNKRRKRIAKSLELKKLIVLHEPLLEDPNSPNTLRPTLGAIPSWLAAPNIPWPEPADRKKAEELRLAMVPILLLNHYAVRLDEDLQRLKSPKKKIITQAGDDPKQYILFALLAYRQSRTIMHFIENATPEDYKALGLMDYSAIRIPKKRVQR